MKPVIHAFDNETTIPEIINNVVEEGTEDSFYVCNISEIIQRFYLWKMSMPNVTPFFAVKSNSHPTLLKTLAALGVNFDCASKPEIEQILSLNVDPERIIYAHPNKPANHLRYASDVGVTKMTFDCESELHKMKRLYPTASAVMRIKSASKKAGLELDSKFGCCSQTEAPQLLELAKELGINVIGVSFHVGFNCQDPNGFRNTISFARSVFDVAKNLGFDFKLLDLGGGYAASPKEFIKTAKSISLALRDYFGDLDITLMAEPGQYFCCSSFTLACNIISTKNVLDEEKQVCYMNEGISSSFKGPLDYGIPLYIYPLKKPLSETKYFTTLFGPTCSSLDKISDDIEFPKLQIGDWLVFENMGAYTMSTSSHFNGFTKGKCIDVIYADDWDKMQDTLSIFKDDVFFKKNDYLDENTNVDKSGIQLHLIYNPNLL